METSDLVAEILRRAPEGAGWFEETIFDPDAGKCVEVGITMGDDYACGHGGTRDEAVINLAKLMNVDVS